MVAGDRLPQERQGRHHRPSSLYVERGKDIRGRRMPRRWAWLCRCVVIPCLAVMGTPGEPKPFRWANEGDPTTLDPHARSDGFVPSSDMTFYEPLIRRDRNLKLEPA